MHKFRSLSAVLSAAAVAAGIVVFISHPAMAAGNIEINSTNFPDNNFRAWILAQDYGYDGILTQNEISQINTINVHDNYIFDLKGISFFTSLKILSCYNNYLTSLDVSGCPELTNLTCDNNALESLDVSGCPELTNITCDNNDLESLDVSGCAKLYSLACNDNKLEYLDVSTNTELDELICGNNNLKKIFFSVNPDMISVNCDEGVEKYMLQQGDVMINSQNFPDENFRKYLHSYISDTGLLRKSYLESTETISVSGYSIKDLTGIENFKSLKNLVCNYNELTSIDVSAFKDLEVLNCSGNRLTELDVTKNDKLKDLQCHSNNLSQLDLSNNTALASLGCANNEFERLDVSKNTALTELLCYDNILTDLDLRNNTALAVLDCNNNQIKSLDVSKNIALIDLGCSNNKLTSLDVSKSIALADLDCSINKLTSLDVSRNPALERLVCMDCGLTSLDVSNNKNLIYLQCEKNEFNTLIIPSNPYLSIACDIDVEKVVLLAADWKLTGVQWVENYVDPSKTTAAALFECTKEGFTDYNVSIPMSVEITTTVDPTCEKEGNYIFEATLPKEISRTGDAITDTKTIKLPATGHTWSKWTVKTPAKILVNGVEARKCSVCGKEETRNIAYLTPTATPTATPSPIPPKVTISMDSKAASVVCGKTITLKAVLVNSKAKIVWKSSDSKIASVDSNGKVTGKKAGTVTITASAAGKQAACPVTIVYKDVTNNEDFWYAPTNYLTANGIVKGYDNQTNFKPKNDCTRAQMVTFLYRLQGEPPVKSTTCKFKDVKKTDYFFKPVIWAVEKGITTGVSKTKFDPQGVCTRAQTVTFLWRMAKKPAPKAKTCKFKDVKAKDYFYKPVIWASEKKIVAGYNDGTFKPQGKCLRRQMVTFLYKYDKFVNGKG